MEIGWIIFIIILVVIISIIVITMIALSNMGITFLGQSNSRSTPRYTAEERANWEKNKK